MANFQTKELLFGRSRIRYYRGGSGPRVVVCFHGYGEEGSTFSFLAGLAGNECTVLAPDLPFHGNTEWNDGPLFTPAHLLALLEALLQDNPDCRGPITLAGFSMGGRMALHLYQSIPERVDRLVLLAPDGLKMNGWYWLATQTLLGNRIFGFTMKHPGWFAGTLRALHALKLVNSSIYKFTQFYIHDREVRQLLYRRWTGFRKIRPRIPQVKELIQRHRTRVRLVYGQHDRIIQTGPGIRFCRGIEDHCSLALIPSGHQVLHAKHAAGILPAILH